MARRKTHEEFVNEINKINNSVEIVGIYKNKREKISKGAGYEQR